MNMICRGSGFGSSVSVLVSFSCLIALVSCDSGREARQWYPADFAAVAEVSETQPGWRFDAGGYLEERLSLLDEVAPSASSEKIPYEFRKVINEWVSDSLAEMFWTEVRRNYSPIKIPLILETGQPDDDPDFRGRAIIRSGKGAFLVRSNVAGPRRPIRLEYSDLSEEEYDQIVSDLVGRYHIFDLESDLSHSSENPPMMVVEAHVGDRHKMLLYGYYRRAKSDTARAMFEYLDSLFWGE